MSLGCALLKRCVAESTRSQRRGEAMVARTLRETRFMTSTFKNAGSDYCVRFCSEAGMHACAYIIVAKPTFDSMSIFPEWPSRIFA
ncbi:hypothetical protein EVAR_44969_1 [Eumeta japonica]|uniref:Uncharacterized protein n=1 Tax=Eumeta variegata TaxID=151549 RepID=A0A4C1W3W0_EUMVA|nr:hypothetical protein EVAR_44969_1 [Eumeta japonica]